jgi:hypothetical protein
LWVFQRVEEGAVVPLPVARYEAWHRGTGALQPLGGHVYVVLIGGPRDNRRPVEVDHLQLSRHTALVDGTRSRAQIDHELREAVNSAFPEALPAGVANLLDGRDKFLRARNRAKWGWEPTPADVEAIRAAINKKARRNLV